VISAIYRATTIRKTFNIIVVGASMSMLTACGNSSSDGSDAAGNTPVDGPADFAGTWMLKEVSEESFGARDNNVLLDELKFRKVSRQLVTITQQNATAQIQLCDEAAITANVSATGLAYDAKTYMPTINNVTDLTPIVQPLVLAKDSAGTLHGSLDSGLIPVVSEPYPNSYQVTREISLVRVSPAVNVGGIGSLTLDWSFQVAGDTTTTERRDEAVSCFVETVRTKSGGEQVSFYGVNGGSTKTLMLDAETVQVTFADTLYSQDVGSHVERSVALKLKPVVSAIGFSQSLSDLSAEEASSFVEASPTLLRQQYSSTPSSLAGTINVDSGDQFTHAQFDLNW